MGIKRNYYLDAPSPVIYLRLVGARYASNNQVAIVIGLTLLVTSLSALFASSILGIFQGGVSQAAMDVRIIKISRLVAGGDKIAWDVLISVRSSGSTVLEIPYVDLAIGDEAITPVSPSNTIYSPLLTIMPGEQKILRVIITNHDPSQLSISNAVIFSDARLASGMIVSIRIIDSGGRTALIVFTLP